MKEFKNPIKIITTTVFNYSISIELWDFCYWEEEYNAGKFYRVLVNNGDDDYRHIFVVLRSHAEQIFFNIVNNSSIAEAIENNGLRPW